MGLEFKRPEKGPLFRIGRRPDAWAAPDWAYAKEDRTFGNRFDDPDGLYRVLYASSQRLGCFIETLARFRVDLSVVADLAQMENGENDFTPFGTVPRTWLSTRSMGTAEVSGQYADIYSAAWVSHLRVALASTAIRLGLRDLDLSSLQRDEPRLLTQRAGQEALKEGLNGVYYISRHGTSIENWAIFEPFPIENPVSVSLVEGDPDLADALRLLGIEFID